MDTIVTSLQLNWDSKSSGVLKIILKHRFLDYSLLTLSSNGLACSKCLLGRHAIQILKTWWKHRWFWSSPEVRTYICNKITMIKIWNKLTCRLSPSWPLYLRAVVTMLFSKVEYLWLWFGASSLTSWVGYPWRLATALLMSFSILSCSSLPVPLLSCSILG